MGIVRLLTGNNASGRSAHIDRLFREHDGRAVLLTPTRSNAKRRLEDLLPEGQGGVWGAPVLEFTDFVEGLLVAEGLRPRRLSDLSRRVLLERWAREVADDMASDFPVNRGIAHHLLRVITQLKQEAIEAEDFMARSSKGGDQTPADAFVARVYAAYQDEVKAIGAFDVPGLYWEAYARAKAKPLRQLAEIDALLLDGFDDFTPSQLRLLDALSAQVSLTAIGLNYDDRPNRQDCFAASAKVAVRIREGLNATVQAHDGSPPATYSTYAADHIFWRDPPPAPDGLAANLRLVPCIDGLHEAEHVARSIRQLILGEGANPADIAVVYRNLAPVAQMLQGIFEGYGVPHHIQTSLPLAQTSAGAFALKLLDIANGWERESVLELLTSPHFQPGVAVAERGHYTQLVRHAQIIAGKEEWKKRLGYLQRRLEQDRIGPELRPLLRALPEPLPALAALQQAVVSLAESLDQLPEKGSLQDHALAFDQLLSGLGLPQTGVGSEAVLGRWSAKSIDGLRQLLSELHDLPMDATVSRSEFGQALQLGLQSNGLFLGGTPGGVRILDAIELRNTTFEHVFLCAMNEGEFPQPAPVSAIYPETERQRLRQAGIELDSQQDHGNRELLLFHGALESARKHLTVSWRLLKDGGREAAPSPYLADLQELFGNAPAIQAPMPRSDSFLPSPERAASIREMRNAFARAGQKSLGLAGEDGARAILAVSQEYARNASTSCGPFEGQLSGLALERVQAHFGADHAFSVSQLECYLDCPFRFWMKYVLQVEESEVPEAEFDPMIAGAILHDALLAFHQRYKGIAVAEIPEQEWQGAIEESLDQAFDRHGWKSMTATEGLVATERRRMGEILLRYLRFESARDTEGCVPQHFEVAFGRTPREGDPLDTAQHFELNTKLGPVRFNGKIDRIDCSEHAAVLIDYKSGKAPTPGEMTSGLSIQLTVYAWAVEQMLLPGLECVEGLYIPLGKAKLQKALNKTVNGYNWPNRESNVRMAIEGAVAGIRRGFFAPVRARKECRGCGTVRACRHDKTALERKGLKAIIAMTHEAED